MAQTILALKDFILRGNGYTVPARVPGDILDDLHRAGAVVDYEKDADYEKIQWVQEADWEYETKFSLSAEDLKKKVYLKFYGVDTFSEVYLNGIMLGRTENMFLLYEYDLRGVVREGENVLRIAMQSPIRRLRSRKNDKYICVFEKDRLFWRKAQCHYGWDWAPEVAGYGIYEPVHLIVRDNFIIEDVTVRTRLNGEITVFAELGYNVFSDYKQFAGKDFLELSVSEYGRGTEVARRTFEINRKKNLINITVPEPKLWWPNTYGAPDLYELQLILRREGEVLDSRTERFGIRTVRIAEEPVGNEDRLTCQMVINGKPIYSKGANWVPLDYRTGIISDEQYRKSLGLAKRGNINMLRVWGGGFYEKEAFYRYCDENGIMVMQEFMLSCSDVPEDDPGFAALISREAEYQVKRLKNRPCVVLWSGGNERATAFCVQKEDKNSFISDYVFRGIVNKYTYGVPYVDHSPWSYTDIDDDEMSGDSHWSCMDKAVAHRDLGHYRDYLNWKVTAFTAECAALGPARMRSMRKFISPENIWPINEIWEKRFRCNPMDSNGINFAYWVTLAVEQMFGAADSAEDLVKKGMCVQYEILFDEVLFLRANSRYNSGFLNWMYGDIWGTGTWSIVDHWLEPKGGYYAMKRAFGDFLVGFIKDVGGEFTFCVINDMDEVRRGNAEFGAKDMRGRVTANVSFELEVPPHSSYKVIVPKDLPQEGYWYAEFCGATTSYFPRYWKGIHWSSDFQSKVETFRGGAKVCITAHSFLRKVYLSVAEECEAYAEDNLFDLQPGETRTVCIYGKNLSADKITVKTFAESWNE